MVSPQAGHADGVGDDLALHLVIRGRDTLEALSINTKVRPEMEMERGENQQREAKSWRSIHLKTVKSLLAAGGLVGDHAADDLPQKLRGSLRVVRATLGVGVVALVPLVRKLKLVAVV